MKISDANLSPPPLNAVQTVDAPPPEPWPPHRPLIEHGSMPQENHIFEHETPRYRAWLDEVDLMDVHYLRTRLKLIMDQLWACGEGTPEQPRDIDRDASWEEAASEIGLILEDYVPEDTVRCRCGAQHFQSETGQNFEQCFDCLDIEGDDTK